MHDQPGTHDAERSETQDDAGARLAAIVDSSDDAIISEDLNGIVQSWSHSAERIFGYQAHEIIGKSIDLLVPPDRQEEQVLMLARLRRGEHIEHLQTVRRTKDDRRLDVSVDVSPIRDWKGIVIGSSKIIHDLSEQHRAVQALRDSEARLRAVVETAVDGILTIDETGTIEWVNSAAIKIFGYNREELIGQNVKILMPEPYHGEHDGYLSNYRHTGHPKIIGIGREVMGRRKDGSTFPIDLAVSQVQLGDRRLFTGIVRDITQRKEAEHALVAAKDAAEAANRAKEHFLSVLSHELRTPLSPVMMTITDLESRPDLPQDVRDDLAMMRRNIELESRLIDDLLDLTRIRRGTLSLHFEAVDVHALARTSAENLRLALRAGNLSLILSLKARHHHVWADPGRLQQVLGNLLSNALKFTPEGGTIEIRSDNDTDDRLVLAVSDTGIGIEADKLPIIFDAFEQGEKTTSRQFGGLGLGLAIARSIAEMHKGTLSAASNGHGKGATFTLQLQTMAMPASRTQSEHPGAGKQSGRVLLVEDHGDTLRILARLLTTFGYTVTTARNVREALAAANHGQFDILLSDIGLPDGSGVEIVRHVKAMHAAPWAIALSGFGLDEDLRRSREAGFDLHLTKPVSFQTLESALRGAMGPLQ